MKTFNSLFFALFAVISLGCDRDEQTGVDTVTYHYDQTQCADPWVSEPVEGRTDLRNLVRQYLEQRGVVVHSVNITTDPGVEVVCLACTCISGNIITVVVNEEHAVTLEDLSFYR